MNHNILEKLSLSRTVLMGFAILWIIFFHTTKLNINLPYIIKFPFFNIGYGGVDIFILLSGFGIYCSLDKNNNNFLFLKKRFLRLLPTIPIIILYMFSLDNISFSQIVGYITQQNFWVSTFANDINYGRFWYIPTIISFYVVSPVLYDIIKHNFSKKMITLLIFFSLVLTIPYWHTLQLIAIGRLPIYIIGMLLGYCFCNKINIPFKTQIYFYILAFFAFCFLIFGYLFLPDAKFEYGFDRYPFIFISIALSFFISELYYFLKDKIYIKNIFKFLNLLGENTLEIYLIEAYILALSLWKLPFFNPINRVLLSIIIGVVYSYLYKRLFGILISGEKK